MNWMYCIMIFGFASLQGMDRQQPVKINLESALQDYYDGHNDTLELRLAFNFYNPDEAKEANKFIPCILQKVPANPDLFYFNSGDMHYIKRLKDLKNFVNRFTKLDTEHEYLILWPSNYLPNIGHVEPPKTKGKLTVNSFIQEMQQYSGHTIYRKIEYMFLIRKGQRDMITKQQKDMRLYLHYGDFGKFRALFSSGSVLEDDPSDTDSEHCFPGQSNYD